MRLVLKDFQEAAVDDLVRYLRRASSDVEVSGDLQAVALSSPTGSGKTVMLTSAIERLLEGDSEFLPMSDAVFLWITDQPQLNEQTHQKMLSDSSSLGDDRLVTVEADFDQEEFAPGTINFVNIQKLGKERDLITEGDKRQFTLWATITNCVRKIPDRFFLVIDEAHRGMMESSASRAEANSIIQKLIKGSPGEIPPVPLVTGISATLERFHALVRGTPRTIRPIEVPIEDVRASGLLKEIVTLFHPTEKQPTDITMLREAARSLRRFEKQWRAYCEQEDERPIDPLLVVQVQDAAGNRISRTNLDEAVDAIEEELGPLPSAALAHCFQEGAPTQMAGKEVRYVAPAAINDALEVRVVFFKTSLNTGWDCPRAEAMMSFRTAIDATSIAQLVGRMVRAPLARRVDSDEFLNSVALYLPHYDKAGLDQVIERLTAPDPENMPPVDFEVGGDRVTVRRDSRLEPAFVAIERLPSYVVPVRRRANQVRRLMKLGRALANDDIVPEAEDRSLAELEKVLASEFERVKATETFNSLVHERGLVSIRSVDWQVGLETAEETAVVQLDISRENVDDLFEGAGRRIGNEGLHKAWWKRRRQEGMDNIQAKLELVALSIDSGVRKRLQDRAQELAQSGLREHGDAINSLPEGRRQTYREIRGLARDPELRRIFLPQEMDVRAVESTWNKHAYVDDRGLYPATLNKWESAVLTEELRREENVTWLRNLPRKPWAIAVPYEPAGKLRAFYPDFIFVRAQGDKLVVDLMDPHHIDLADAPAKAVGLAKYAAKHADQFGRIELIIVRANKDILPIDLIDEAKRDQVLEVKTKEHLNLLFEQ